MKTTHYKMTRVMLRLKNNNLTDLLSDGRLLNFLLRVESINGQSRMVRLDVRVDIGSVFSLVDAIGTPETRFFAAFLQQMAVKASIPFIRLSAIVTIEASSKGRLGRDILKASPLHKARGTHETPRRTARR